MVGVLIVLVNDVKQNKNDSLLSFVVVFDFSYFIIVVKLNESF